MTTALVKRVQMAGERISRENIKTKQGFLHCILFRNDHENLLEILLKQQNFIGEQVKKIYHSSMLRHTR